MWKTFVLVHNGQRQPLLEALERNPLVVNWRAAVGGVFIVTEVHVDVNQIAMPIREALPNLRFIISPIGGFSQGSADQETWDFLNAPQPVTKPHVAA